MTQRKKDRSDYRCMESRLLIKEVREGFNVDWQELAIVLAEKLESSDWRMDADLRDYDHTRRCCSRCCCS